MLRIQAICLGDTQKFTGDYQTIQSLEEEIFAKYQKYLVQKNVKTTRVRFILTYTDAQIGVEKLLEDINVIKQSGNQWFELSVKRIWNACCACVSPFGITPAQIPCECENKKCNYQYCSNCVRMMRAIKHEKNEIYCMYCGNASLDGPKPNQLLLNLLWEQYTIKYGMESLRTKSIMPRTLSNDIECRIIHIKSLIQTLKAKPIEKTSQSESIRSTIEDADILVKKLEDINKFSLKGAGRVDKYILNNCLQEYIDTLTGDVPHNRTGEHFIMLCEKLLYYIQETEFEKNFPLLHKKMNEWESLLSTNDNFQPKIIDVFKACEGDLGQHIIPSIPCRVGFIGQISVGKTSLSNQLRGIKKEMIQDNMLVSPMHVTKSTYCQLEFEHEFDDGRKIILVDIEGSSDIDPKLKSGNYFDEIAKADYTQHAWYNYITNDLHRECWLVRNKVDELFLSTFEENIGQDFDSSSDETKAEWSEQVIELVRQTVSIDIHGEELPNVYLTFTSFDKNSRNRNLSTFDLEKLKNDINNLPTSLHRNRLQKMALNAMARVINNCFRRGYVINVMKYKIAAGIAAAIPFFDLIPRYYGREEIRQAFGINTRSRFMSWITGQTDVFKDYLNKVDITVNECKFRTSAFKKTFKNTAANAKHAQRNLGSAVVKGAMAVGVAGVSLSDDAIRAVGVFAINGARAASTSLVIVGAVVTVGMCAWAAVSNGKQLYNYLNKLCDDLIIVSEYAVMKFLEDNNEIHNLFIEQI